MSNSGNKYQKVVDEEEVEVEELHEGTQPVVVVEQSETETEEPADAITVRVKSADEKNHDVRVSVNSKVSELKAMLAELTGYPSERQRLICLGKLLADDKTLLESNVKDGNFVHLVPKPAASSTSTSASTSQSIPVAQNIDEVEIPAHLREYFATQASMRVSADESFRMDPEDVYELNIWRYRVRVLGMLMLFYYFMTLMASISLWMNPQDDDEYPRGGQFRQVKSDIPLQLVDTIENVLGIMVAIVGLKTAVSDSVPLAIRFSREINTLCFVHFVNLFMWIVALDRGEIVPVPVHRHRSHSTSEEEREESINSIIGAMLIVHPLIWVTILSIAHRYKRMLQIRDAVMNPPQAQPENNTNNQRGVDVV